MPHTEASDGGDVAVDYRCAGLAIPFHTAGVAASPSAIWAGQWLFTDEAGRFHRGTCTFNRGTHPTASAPSVPVGQRFPNDPTGRKGAYLSWRYGSTTDDLTAAAVWAVFHYYAADAAGSNRSADPSAPLVPRLDRLAAMSGRSDLEALAVRLDAEAATFAGEWALTVQVVRVSEGEADVTVALAAGAVPVPGHPVDVLVSGDDAALPATTGTDGHVTVRVPATAAALTVAATTEAPGAVAVYRGTPAAPNPLGAQLLAAAGAPTVLQATAGLDAAPAPTSTTSTSTTSTSTTTTVPTTAPTTTAPPVVTTAPAPTVPLTTVPATRLPRTGRGTDGLPAWLATALLVGGIGLLGTIRRQPLRSAG